MAFGMGKKTAEELLKLFSALSDEEKAKFLAGVKPNAETDEPVAEEPADEPEADGDAAPEPTEEPAEETAEEEGEQTGDEPTEEPAAESPPADNSEAETEPPAAEDGKDIAEPADDWRARIEKEIGALKAALDGMQKAPQPADDQTSGRLTELESKFN